MKPFCGYNFADYWTHWLSFEGRVKQLPKIFHVNWFRQDKDGKFSGRASATTCACCRGSSTAARPRQGA